MSAIKKTLANLAAAGMLLGGGLALASPAGAASVSSAPSNSPGQVEAQELAGEYPSRFWCEAAGELGMGIWWRWYQCYNPFPGHWELHVERY
ncbi:hypothetical protein ACIRPH_15905 [Nocardiopsis sp. NPDC101807]|uniref:hypothetical protein n=1 Tax=Nocardiopsis sp. NPDC101807 TaxID=3364339 RepID=UPI00382A4BB4